MTSQTLIDNTIPKSLLSTLSIKQKLQMLWIDNIYDDCVPNDIIFNTGNKGTNIYEQKVEDFIRIETVTFVKINGTLVTIDVGENYYSSFEIVSYGYTWGLRFMI